MSLPDPQRGRIYRRCGCRDAAGRQYGARCPRLNAQSDHGRWAYAVDLPSASGKRETRRRSGFPDENAALTALQRFLAAERTGITLDETLTVAEYLTEWLLSKQEVLKATTFAGTTATSTTTSYPPSAPCPCTPCATGTSPPGPEGSWPPAADAPPSTAAAPSSPAR
ncbi:hypothetical protein ACIQOW_18575 [Kitasatospora sp. NPDC091335]|uniref:hypothetical protein n=1 Tax=Kitasatospora sp. NPDC091335 TaxID=3364085 RepID=UPI0037FF38BE